MDHAKWRFIDDTRDSCSLIIHLDREEYGRPQIKMALHNIYNPHQAADGRRSALLALRRALERYEDLEQMVVGDFNLHHNLWGGPQNIRSEPEADILIEIMEKYSLSSTLPRGTITYNEANARTTIDLSLLITGLLDRIVKSMIDHDIEYGSDHLPIATTLDLNTKQLPEITVRNWKALNPKKFDAALKRELPNLQKPRTKAALDQ